MSMVIAGKLVKNLIQVGPMSSGRVDKTNSNPVAQQIPILCTTVPFKRKRPAIVFNTNCPLPNSQYSCVFDYLHNGCGLLVFNTHRMGASTTLHAKGLLTYTTPHANIDTIHHECCGCWKDCLPILQPHLESLPPAIARITTCC